MTSPVGHGLGAYLANRGRYPATVDGSKYQLIAGLALLVFAGNAPDLDFIWGAWKGDMNAYHHGPSHSIVAVFLFAGLLWGLTAFFRQYRYLAVSGGLAYASHIVLDLVTIDKAAPYGMQLLWPFSDAYMLAPWAFFLNIEHGNLGESVFTIIPAIFTAHNISAIGFELLILGPPALLMFLWQGATNRKNTGT